MDKGRDVRAVCYSADVEITRSLHVGPSLRHKNQLKETFADGIDVQVVQVFCRVLVLLSFDSYGCFHKWKERTQTY